MKPTNPSFSVQELVQRLHEAEGLLQLITTRSDTAKDISNENGLTQFTQNKLRYMMLSNLEDLNYLMVLLSFVRGSILEMNYEMPVHVTSVEN